MPKPNRLSQELTKLTKRIRQFPGGAGVGAPGGPPGEEGEEEEGDLVTGPVEQWLKRMIKGSPSTPKPQNHSFRTRQERQSSIHQSNFRHERDSFYQSRR